MRFFAAIVTFAGLLFGGAPTLGATDTPASHAEARVVKAAYIYNFTKFVERSGESEVRDPHAPITIGVLGRDAVAMALTENAPLESLGRPLRVVPIARGEKLPRCDVLYIALSEASRLGAVLEEVEGGVLTVSDIPRFTDGGGMIGFVAERERVRIEVNVPGLRAAGLSVSSKLLEIARIKKGEKR